MLIKRAQKQRGTGLVELMVSMALAAMVTGAILTLFTSGTRELARMFHYCELNQNTQMAVDIMSRDIRNANRVLAYTANTLDLEGMDGVRISYVFDPVGFKLSRTRGAQVEPDFLTDCESLTFALGRRNPTKDYTYDFPPSASPTESKIVSIRLKSFRTLLGHKQITENVTTANVVIRRQ